MVMRCARVPSRAGTLFVYIHSVVILIPWCNHTCRLASRDWNSQGLSLYLSFEGWIDTPYLWSPTWKLIILSILGLVCHNC